MPAPPPLAKRQIQMRNTKAYTGQTCRSKKHLLSSQALFCKYCKRGKTRKSEIRGWAERTVSCVLLENARFSNFLCFAIIYLYKYFSSKSVSEIAILFMASYLPSQ